MYRCKWRVPAVLQVTKGLPYPSIGRSNLLQGGVSRPPDRSAENENDEECGGQSEVRWERLQR